MVEVSGESAGVPFGVFPKDCQLFIDTLVSGWGVYCIPYMTQGVWSEAERGLHVNQLRAIKNTLHSFAGFLQGRRILITTDNVTAVYYLNRQGGHQLSQAVCGGVQNLALCNRVGHAHHSNTHCRHTEYNGRHIEQECRRTYRNVLYPLLCPSQFSNVPP